MGFSVMRIKRYIVVSAVLLSATAVWAESAGSLLSRARKEPKPAARVQLLTKALAKDSHLVNAYHYRGDAYLELGKTDFAIKDYTRTIELRPKDPFRYYARGLAYLQQKKYALAQSDFSKAILLKPSYADFYLGRARAYGGLEKYENALADYRTYQKKSSRPEDLSRELIPVYLGAFRYDDAQTSVDKVLETGDDSAEVHYWQGRLLAGKDRVDEAISSYSKAINRDVSYAVAYRYRGDLFKEIGDYEAAADDYTQLIQLQPEALFYNKRGLTYEAMKDFRAAAQDYTHAIEMSPNWAVPYNNRGFAKMNLQEWAGAKADLEKAVALDASAPTPYVNLAGLYWTWKKNSNKMYEYLSKAQRHHFKNADMLFNENQKGWLFKDINQTKRFRSAFSK